MHVNKRVTVTQNTVLICFAMCYMLNIQKSKNTVLISNISIITFLNFAFYTRAASLLASKGLEAILHEAKAKTHEAEAEVKTQEAEARFFDLEAEARPRGLTSLVGTHCSALVCACDF